MSAPCVLQDIVTLRPSQVILGFAIPSSTTTHLVGIPSVPSTQSVLISFTKVPLEATESVQLTVDDVTDMSFAIHLI